MLVLWLLNIVKSISYHFLIKLEEFLLRRRTRMGGSVWMLVVYVIVVIAMNIGLIYLIYKLLKKK